MHARRFRHGPGTPACFIVRDGNEQALAYIYCEDEPGRRAAAKLLMRDEARAADRGQYRRAAGAIRSLSDRLRFSRQQP